MAYTQSPTTGTPAGGGPLARVPVTSLTGVPALPRLTFSYSQDTALSRWRSRVRAHSGPPNPAILDCRQYYPGSMRTPVSVVHPLAPLAKLPVFSLSLAVEYARSLRNARLLTADAIPSPASRRTGCTEKWAKAHRIQALKSSHNHWLAC